MRSTTHLPFRILHRLVVGALLSAATTAVLVAEPLTLRLSDVEAPPGGIAAVVVRTYASRPVGQGQLCVRRTFGPGGEGLLTGVEGAVVFATEGDSLFEVEFDPVAQTVMLTFSSVSASINELDGPLAVLYLRVADDAMPGAGGELAFDLGPTELIGADGLPIPLELRPGDLAIRAPGAPVTLEAEGDRVEVGSVAHLGVSTLETFPIGSGQVALVYPPEIAAGVPEVSMDPRHGLANLTANVATPGLVVVSFDSPDGSLNEVPGVLVGIALPTRSDVAPGEYPVSIVPELSWLASPVGPAIPYAAVPDVLELLPLLFRDGFESGDFIAWSAFEP